MRLQKNWYVKYSWEHSKLPFLIMFQHQRMGSRILYRKSESYLNRDGKGRSCHWNNTML